MTVSFITGTITADGKPCPTATVTSPTIVLACLDGSFIEGAHNAGSHVLTIHAPGCKPVTKVVDLTLKRAKG